MISYLCLNYRVYTNFVHWLSFQLPRQEFISTKKQFHETSLPEITSYVLGST